MGAIRIRAVWRWWAGKRERFGGLKQKGGQRATFENEALGCDAEPKVSASPSRGR